MSFDDIEGWNDDGSPKIMTLANAIQCWTLCQNRTPITVAEAASQFKLPVERIASAVDEHPWMYLAQDDGEPLADAWIEHDGE